MVYIGYTIYKRFTQNINNIFKEKITADHNNPMVVKHLKIKQHAPHNTV